MDGVEKASDAIFKCHETPKVIEYYCSELFNWNCSKYDSHFRGFVDCTSKT